MVLKCAVSDDCLSICNVFEMSFAAESANSMEEEERGSAEEEVSVAPDDDVAASIDDHLQKEQWKKDIEGEVKGEAVGFEVPNGNKIFLSTSGASLADNERNPSAGLLQEGQEEHFLQRLEKRDDIEREAEEKAVDSPL
jgi:hypothetical protein